MATTSNSYQATETEAEVMRRSGETVADWVARLAIRDMVRRAEWLKAWQVSEIR